MLSAMGRLAGRFIGQRRPWTNVYGLGRTLLALSTALTLAANRFPILFRPIAGFALAPPFCQAAMQRVDYFCVLRAAPPEVARWCAVGLLLLVASGWRPRITGLIHWYVSLSFQLSAATVDGGDQAAAALTLLLLPLALTDDRKWHWSRAHDPGDETRNDVKRLIALNSVAMVRVQVAAIYFHAAAGKMRVTEWADGTALYYWLTHPLFGVNEHFKWLVRPIITHAFSVSLLTWGVIVLEALLAAGLLASRQARKVLLPAGLALHAGILIFQGLFSFSLTMFGALILFLRPVEDEFEFARIAEPFRLARIAPRSRGGGTVGPTADASTS